MVSCLALNPLGRQAIARSSPSRRSAVARLDAHADEIVAGGAYVALSYPGGPLVPLCFEDVHGGEHCHRLWFAKYFEDRDGIEVPELIDADQAS